jgi:LPXTG-motif cell wall-anchored protein
MKSIGIAGVAALLLSLCCQSALAQSNCGNITFSGEIASRFPNARNACLDVVTKEGQQFAHFKARIRNVSGNKVEAEFKQADGSWGRPAEFQMDPSSRIRIAGQSYRYRDLSRGQELDVYLPPDRWAIAVPQTDDTDFVTAQAVQIVPLQEPSATPTFAANLPRTGSPIPLVGVLGLAFLALGSVALLVRKRLT